MAGDVLGDAQLLRKQYQIFRRNAQQALVEGPVAQTAQGQVLAHSLDQQVAAQPQHSQGMLPVGEKALLFFRVDVIQHGASAKY